ncbi:MAG: ROK family protein [Pirellulales bacterium]
MQGWDAFPLADWARERFDLPAIVANDADTAALAEARLGAGRDANPVFYITVGTGIGAGLVLDGQIYRGHGVSVAELGHLRPGLQAEGADQILESYAAGWGIASAAQARLRDPMSYRLGELRANRRRPEDIRQRLIEIEEAGEADAGDLLDRCDGQPDRLSTKLVVEAAAAGNGIAAEILRQAWQALGWGIAQAITLLSPEVVVIGGGVSLAGRELFFEPLEREVERYVFPPLKESYRIVPAALGEEVVLYGALALAAEAQAAAT